MFPIGICTDFINLPDIAGLGFDYAELPLDVLAALPEAEYREFVNYAEGSGLAIAACNHMLPDDLPITGPGVNAAALHGYLNHALGRAHRLGVRVVILDAAKARSVPQDADYPFAWRQLGNFLRLAQGHARDCGIIIAVEPLRKSDCSLLNLVSEATLITGLLQLDNIAVAAHTGHMALASEPLSTLRKAAPLLCHMHVENALTRRLPKAGDGEDYGRITELLTDIGYAGRVSLSGVITGTFVQDAKEALDLMRKSF